MSSRTNKGTIECVACLNHSKKDNKCVMCKGEKRISDATTYGNACVTYFRAEDRERIAQDLAATILKYRSLHVSESTEAVELFNTEYEEIMERVCGIVL